MELVYFTVAIHRAKDEDYENLNRLLKESNAFEFEFVERNTSEGPIYTASVGKQLRIKKKTKKTIFELAQFLLLSSTIISNTVTAFRTDKPGEQIQIEQQNTIYNVTVETEDQVYNIENSTRDEAIQALDSLRQKCE